MAGTEGDAVFVKVGDYLSMVADNAITLGQLVSLTTTGTDTCDVAGAADTTVVGVATGGDRYSRTSTDNVVAAGNKVTICTRGVVRVTTDTSTIVRGSYLESAASGTVALAGTAGTPDVQDIVGQALDANGGAAAEIRMRLMRH